MYEKSSINFRAKSAGMDMSQTEIHVLFTRFANKITATGANGRNDCVHAYR